MKDDGILEEGLQDLNAGQSHRARLISQALPAYLPQSPALPLPRSALEEAQQFFLQVKGRNPSRGGGRGGRGGGIAGSQPDRHAQRRFVYGQQDSISSAHRKQSSDGDGGA